jgi:hypothetical protein
LPVVLYGSKSRPEMGESADLDDIPPRSGVDARRG